MKAKFSIALLAMLGGPILLVSAPAQEPQDRNSVIGVTGRIMGDSNNPPLQRITSQPQIARDFSPITVRYSRIR